MIVDRRKDSYDELVVLARDSHTSRRRANVWTTTLIVAGALASAAYVATINAEMDALDDANQEVVDLTLKLDVAERDRDLYRAQRDIYLQNAIWFADQSSMKILGNDIVSLGDKFTLIAGTPSEPGSTVSMVNNVMIVDGSRRFPMTDEDILWVPEHNLWVSLEAAADGDPDDPRETGRTLRKVILNYNSPPGTAAATSRTEFLGGPYRYFEEKGEWSTGSRGAADCLRLSVHYQSNRPAFAGNPNYVDMEVLLYNSEGACPDVGQVVVVPPSN